MWEPVALCCFTRRTGCLVLGSLDVIAAAFSLLLGMYLWFVEDFSPFNSVCYHNHAWSVETCEEALHHFGDDFAIWSGVVNMVCATMMIHGVRKNEHLLIAPFLVKNVIALVLVTILAGVAVVLLCIENFMMGILGAYVYGALIFMSTYFLLTVRAYYYELRRDQADDCRLLVEDGVTKDGFPH